jgi:hypothetical protein
MNTSLSHVTLSTSATAARVYRVCTCLMLCVPFRPSPAHTTASCEQQHQSKASTAVPLHGSVAGYKVASGNLVVSSFMWLLELGGRAERLLLLSDAPGPVQAEAAIPV